MRRRICSRRGQRPDEANAGIIASRSSRGLVERVTFHNGENGFGVLRAKARGHHDLVTVVGQQFKGRFLKTSAPSSIDGIEKYLGSGMIRDIGPVYAKKMVKSFGEKVFDVIEAEPDRLREVTGIGAVRAKRITDAWAEQKIVRQIMVFFTATGWEPPGRFASSRPTARTPCKS
jgi:exodeoxyribonuclease V alpha subunit